MKKSLLFLIFFMIAVMLFYRGVTSIIEAQAASPNNASKTKTVPVNSSPAQKITFTANGKIITGKSIGEKTNLFVDAATFLAVTQALEAKGELDSKGKIVTINFTGRVEEPKNLVPPTDKILVIVLNGKIYKTVYEERQEDIFLPLSSIEALLNAAGATLNSDAETSIVAVYLPKQAKTEESKQEKPLPSPSPGKKEENKDKTQEQINKISEYLKSLKKILKENRILESEGSQIDDIFVSAVGNKEYVFDFKSVKNRYTKAFDSLKKLNPPDRDTKSIHNLTLGFLGNALKLMNLATKIIDAKKEIDKSQIIQEGIGLIQEIRQEKLEIDVKLNEMESRYTGK